MSPKFPSAFVCPECGKELAISTSVANKSLECTGCGKRFGVPDAKIKPLDLYYPDDCPRSHRIEDIVNRGGGEQTKIESCLLEMSHDEFLEFVFACLLCWSRAERFDDRNRIAVLASRRILERAPTIGLCIHNESILRDACHFTKEAHRECQNLLFRVALAFLKQEKVFGIVEWYESQNFVLASDKQSLIPRAEWHPYSI